MSHAFVEVRRVDVALENDCSFDHALLSVRSDEEAAVIVMFDAPVKVVLFIVAPGESAEAVPASPDHVPAVERDSGDPAVPEPERGEFAVTVESLLLNVFQSAAERTPAVEPEEVAEEITGVLPPVDESGHVALTLVTVPLPLLLNVVQSVEERHPACEPEAV